uniref:Vesicle transport v-SNARE N-terminal domain-containing protein n=1 Tax=Trieres chinensis TaxID=1514140 RepID=A0A7S1ZUM9_TRICV|mmetsp:Transcript_32990/g.67318  ORF Transcript_32990/g.67318 Transcript_32990/m.67318 type:complete len:248 (+) Transcript_32990:135-878(+)
MRMESLLAANHDEYDEEGGASSAMSTVPFERYDEEFLSLSEQVRRSLDSLNDDLEKGGVTSVESDLKMSSNLLSQCDDLLKQMGLEARGADNAESKKELLGKVKVCKSKLSSLKSDYEAARNRADRAGLGLDPSTSGASGGGLKNDHRERLLRTNDQLSRQNETLENARRIMADTEGVALEITDELGRNRETIESAKGRVRDVSGLTNRARRIVQSMNRREVQQKLAMYVVSFALILVIIVIMFGMR